MFFSFLILLLFPSYPFTSCLCNFVCYAWLPIEVRKGRWRWLNIFVTNQNFNPEGILEVPTGSGGRGSGSLPKKPLLCLLGASSSSKNGMGT